MSRRLLRAVRMYQTCVTGPPSFSLADRGKLYCIPKEQCEQLNLVKNFPSTLSKQMETLGECVTLARPPIIELSSCMSSVHPSIPSLRFVLWGSFGTGKSVTIGQLLHVALLRGWVIVHLRSAMELCRKVAEIEMSWHHTGRINDPGNAVAILQQFKEQNAHVWSKLAALKTTKTYEWTKKETTAEGRPLVEIVEMGLSAPFLATDCAGALFRELSHCSSQGSLNVLVALDNANSLWGKTLVKKADRTFASPAELTLVHHYRKLVTSNWKNGMVVLVADKKEVSDARDKVTVPRNTPLELFGEEGFDAIQPFVPIQTSLYTKEEADALFEYYVEMNWLSSSRVLSPSGRQQLFHLSAFNPFHFERLCAFQ